MTSSYMNHLVRSVGKSYKDIYSSNKNQDINLRDKYVGIEKQVLKDSKKVDCEFLPEDLEIPFHAMGHYSFGGRAHLQFDDIRPEIHLISYNTDVADYNIKTDRLFMGNDYSMTTTNHMSEFNYLFDFLKLPAQQGQGKLVHDNILNVVYHKGTAPTSLLDSNAQDYNLILTLSQVKQYSDLMVNIYNYAKANKIFKYQLEQIGSMLTTLADDYDYYDVIIDCNNEIKLENTAKRDLKHTLLVIKDGNKKDLYNNLSESVDVNNYWDGNDFIERNLNKSFNVLIKCIQKTVKNFDKEKVA